MDNLKNNIANFKIGEIAKRFGNLSSQKDIIFAI